MRQAFGFLALGLLGGFAVSAWWPAAPDKELLADVGVDRPSDRRPRADSGVDSELAARVDALGRELDQLRRDVTRLLEASTTEPSVSEAATESAAPGAVEVPEALGDTPASPRERRFRMRSSEGRIESLAAAGFSLDRAQYIERRTEELRVEAMQARYDATRRGESGAALQGLLDADAMLRAELGDGDYERYRTAMGQPTAVNVATVLASSAAEQVGLQRGDQIVAYAGARVFDVRELNQALLGGEPGESVVVDIVRDGQPMQLVLPRGPLGITSGFGPGMRPAR